jgi:hypothetical protein
MAVDPDDKQPLAPAVVTADAKLINWALYLPESKRVIMAGDRGKRMDEPLFQSHVLLHTLKIYLHRPRSTLEYSSVESLSQCTPPPTNSHGFEVLRQRGYAFHTQKTLEAIETCITLYSLPSPFIKHTPIIICGLAMAIMGQLSACTIGVEDGSGSGAARERVRLGIGALKAYDDAWALGKKTTEEVKIMARELLGIPRKTTAGLGKPQRIWPQISCETGTEGVVGDSLESGNSSSDARSFQREAFT